MEKLKLEIQQTPEATSQQLAKRCQSENAQRIWAVTTKLIAELRQHGSLKDTDQQLIEKQQTLCEKLAGRDPDHVAAALKAHEEGDAERPGKPWFPHIGDLIPHIDRLERRDRAIAEAQRKRNAAWHSGKEDTDFVDDPLEVRQANVARWRNHYRSELIADGAAAEEADLSEKALAYKRAREARAKLWKDPQNDHPSSITRLKESMETWREQCRTALAT